ncbi:MAG: FAD-dependent monooxygenase [Planctomycetota bacterium]|nr:FAD-dependent monooxygenase [Planctomycetota bacterium]
MVSQTTNIDVLVLGGGPAGSAVAGLLAQGGLTVWLVDEDRERFAAPYETLLPAALRAIERCGLAEAVRAASVADSRRHGAVWDTPDLLWHQEAPPGLCLHRPRFNAAMRDWAARAGAKVQRGRVAELPDDARRPVVIDQADGEPKAVVAQLVVLATGRRRSSRVPTERVAQGAETAAFALSGQAAAGFADHAVVEAAERGWSWWIGAPDQRSVAVVCVDADELSEHGRRSLVDRVLQQARGPVASLRGHRITGAVRATSRLLRVADQATRSLPVLLVGDAVATLDPLASQGSEKALVGAEAAALAIQTALREPRLTQQALAWHWRWERDLWQAQQKTAGHFYSRVTRFAGEHFWRTRSADEDPPPALPVRLLARADLRETPVLQRRGQELVEETGFGAPGIEGLSRVGHVQVGPILAAFAQAATLDEGLRQAGQQPALFALGPPLVRAAIDQLWQRGLLVAADEGA